MSLLLVLLAVLAPGVYASVSGRRLPDASDPALADRHFARSRRLGLVTVVALVILGVAAPAHAWWSLPLAVLGTLTGAWPARRRLYDESWSFLQYLRWSLRAAIGLAGFWVLLLVSPFVVLGLADVHPAIAAGAAAILATLLGTISAFHTQWWIAVHGAQRLGDPDLTARFDAILQRAECARPGVYRYGVPGGHILNGFALPSVHAPAVAFGSSLLERLSADEVAAIFAHEVAHLEHFTPARLRRIGALSALAILVATALPLLVTLRAPGLGLWVTLLGLATVLILVSRQVGRSQANETASDVRAAELTGDPETLIRALTKLHLHLRLPRQWPGEVDEQISHPSLARRIQAIREASRTEDRERMRTTIVRSTHAGTRIAFDDSRAFWFEGVPEGTGQDLASLRDAARSYRALSYAELSELRVVAAGTGRALRARDLQGHAWAVTIHPDDLPLLQRALDQVDTKLGRLQREGSRARARLLAGALFLALMAAGELGIVLVPIAIVLAWPTVASLAAMGAMAIAQAGAMLFAGELALGIPATLAGALGMTIVGGCALWLARAGAAADRRRRPSSAATSEGRAFTGSSASRPVFLTLGGVALVAAAIVTSVSLEGAGDSLLAHPATLVLAIATTGFTAALAALDGRRWGRLGLALSFCGLIGVIGVAQSSVAAQGAPLPVIEREAARIGAVELPRGGYRLELSPGAQLWAVQSVLSEGSTYQDDDELTFRWTIGAVAGGKSMVPASLNGRGADSASRAMAEVDAIDLAFVDDERYIALAWRDDSLEIRTGRAMPTSARARTAPQPRLWERRLPSLLSPALLVDVPGERWVVTGRRDDGALVGFAGRFDGSAPTHHLWPADSLWMQPLRVGADGAALAYAMRVRTSVREALLAMFMGSPLRGELWRLMPQGRVRVGVVHGIPICRGAGESTLCISRDLHRTTLWHASDAGAPIPIGILPPGYDVRHLARSGAVTALARDGTGPLVWDAEAPALTRVLLRGVHDRRRPPVAIDAQSADDIVAILEVGGPRTTIGLYRLLESTKPAIALP